MALVNPQQQMVAPPKASLSGAFQRGAQAIVGARRNALLAQGEGVVRQALRELSDEGVLEPEERQQFELADYGNPEVVGQALATLSALRKTRRIDKEIEEKVLQAVPQHLGEEQAAEWALTEGALRLSPAAAERFKQTFGWMEDMIGKRKAAAAKTKEADTTAPIFAAFVAEVNDALTDPKLTEDAKRKIILDASKDYPELYGYKPFVDFKNTLDIDAARQAASGKRPSVDDAKVELAESENWRKSQSDFLGRQRAWNTIQSLGTDSASDIALVFSYMKLLDPTSTVRESEFKQALETVGLKEQAKLFMERGLDGFTLGDTGREKLMNVARSMYAGAVAEYEPVFKEKRAHAADLVKRGMNIVPRYMIPDLRNTANTFRIKEILSELKGGPVVPAPEEDDAAMEEMMTGGKPKGGK